MAAKHPLGFTRGPAVANLGKEPFISGEDISWKVDKINAGEKLVSKSVDPKLSFTISGLAGNQQTPDTNLSYTTGKVPHEVYYEVKAVNGTTETTLAVGYLVIATSGPPTTEECNGKHHPWQKHTDRVRIA